jgi:quinohemoprotein amine dehydrogenase
MDKAIAHLSAAFPLNTPEWSAWAATMRPPRLEGTWSLAGYEPGTGPVFGQVIVRTDGGADSGQFTTESTVITARTGQSIARRGRAIVYGGFEWRGKSDDWREVLFVDRDWRHASGRWFTGAYDERGIDVRLERVGGDPMLLGAAQPMLKTGVSGQELRLYGTNLPAAPAPADVSLGAGVTVDRVVRTSLQGLDLSILNLSLTVARDATAGHRTILVSGAAGTADVAVYQTIDFIKVQPQAGLARIGGINFPKQFQQFEAFAYANGPDGKPDTGDDIELGRVDATWSLEEYTATYDDDDKDFVGTIDAATGLFTPNVDGPNPKRRHGTDNFGDVWVVAACAQPDPAGASGSIGRVLKARAHLLVTVPLYIKWDQPEVAR